MSQSKFQLKFRGAAAFASAAVLLLGACGQAGPLYLPDQGSHKNKSLKREQRAKTTGNSRVPTPDDDNDAASPAPPAPMPAPAPNPP